jgi:hypothetical protein
MNSFLKKILLGGVLLGATLPALAAGSLKVSVTDLAYEERVQEYFRNITASEKSSLRASGRESERDSDSSYSGSLMAHSMPNPSPLFPIRKALSTLSAASCGNSQLTSRGDSQIRLPPDHPGQALHREELENSTM